MKGTESVRRVKNALNKLCTGLGQNVLFLPPSEYSPTLCVLPYLECPKLQLQCPKLQTTTPSVFLSGLHSCLFALSGHLPRSIGYLKLNISVLEIIKE